MSDHNYSDDDDEEHTLNRVEHTTDHEDWKAREVRDAMRLARQVLGDAADVGHVTQLTCAIIGSNATDRNTDMRSRDAAANAESMSRILYILERVDMRSLGEVAAKLRFLGSISERLGDVVNIMYNSSRVAETGTQSNAQTNRTRTIDERSGRHYNDGRNDRNERDGRDGRDRVDKFRRL